MAKVVHTELVIYTPGEVVRYTDVEWHPSPGAPFPSVIVMFKDDEGYPKGFGPPVTGQSIRYVGVPFSARVWAQEEPDAGA